MTRAAGGTTEPPSQRFPLTPYQVVAVITAANGVIALIAAVATHALTIVNVLSYVGAVGLFLYFGYAVGGFLFLFLSWLLGGKEPKWVEIAAIATMVGVAGYFLIFELPEYDPRDYGDDRIFMPLLGLGFIVFPIAWWWYKASPPGRDTKQRPTH